MTIEELVIVIKADITDVKAKIEEVKQSIRSMEEATQAVKKGVKGSMDGVKKSMQDVGKSTQSSTNEIKKSMDNAKESISKTGNTTQILGRNMKRSMQESKSSMQDAKESAVTYQKSMENLRSKVNDLEGAHRSQASAAREATKEVGQIESVASYTGRSFKDLLKEAQLAYKIKVPSDEYQQLKSAIEAAKTELSSLIEKSRKMQASGKDIGLSKEYKELARATEGAQKKLNNLLATESQMKASGKNRSQSQEYKELERAVEGARKKLNNLLATEDRIKGTGGRQRGAQWNRLQYNIKEARNELEAYRVDLQNLEAEGGGVEESAKFVNLQGQIATTQQELARYQSQMSSLEAQGEQFAPTEQFAALQSQIQSTQETLSDYQSQVSSLENSGQDAVLAGNGLSSGSYIQNAVAVAKQGIEKLKENISNGMSIAGIAVTGFIQKIPVIGRVATETAYVAKVAFSGLESAMSTLGKGAVKAGGFLRSLGSKIRSLIPHSNTTKKSMNDLGLTTNNLSKSLFKLGNMFKLMLIRMAMRAAIEGIREGFQNLAKYSNSFNQSMSMLMSSMTQLKNSFATAFAPLINAVAPILNKIIHLFITAANAIGQFFAALTGKGFYVRAKAVQQDYAKSLDNATGSAKKAKKAADEYKKSIMGFDELNPLTSQNKGSDGDSGNGGGGDGGLSPGDMFETVPVESKFQELAEKLKKLWAEIFAPMKAAWETYGEGVIKAWKRALEEVLSLAKSIGKSFLEVWTNGTGEKFCGNILQLITEIGLAIGDVAVAFRNAWEDNGRGTKLIQSYFDKWNSIMELILSISKSMRTVWNSGSGEKIIGHILEIWTDINEIISNIADGLKEAWNLDGTGTKILQDLADIFEDLLEHINKITKSLKSWSKDLDFGPLLKSIRGITGALKPLSDKVGAGLEWFFTNVLEPLLKWAVEQAIPAALNAIKGALELLDAVLESLKPFGDWLWNDFLKPLAKWTGGMVVDILNGIGKAFSDLADIISDSDGFLDALVDVGGYLIDGLKKGIVTAIKGIGTWIKDNIIDPVVDNVKDLFGIHSPSTVFAEIGGYLIDGLTQGITGKWNDFIDFVRGLPTKIVKAFGDIKTKFTAKGNDIVSGIKKGWNDLSSGFRTTVAGWKNNVVTWFGDIKTKFIVKGNDITNGIKKGWSNLASEFKTTISGWKDSVVTWFGNIKTKFESKGKDIVSGIKKGWSDNFNGGLDLGKFLADIPDTIKNKIGSLYDIGKGIIETFISGFKALSLPKIKITTTYDSNGFGASLFKAMGFSGTPKINLGFYANGGFPDMGELFIANENGPEFIGNFGRKPVVANNNQLVDMVVATASKLIGQQPANVTNATSPIIELSIAVDNEILYKQVLKGQKKSNRRYSAVTSLG